MKVEKTKKLLVNQEQWWAEMQCSIKKGELARFKLALETGKVFLKEYEESICEKLLSTADCAEFLTLCIAHKHISFENVICRHIEAVLYYFVKSLNFCNLFVLLYNDEGVEIDVNTQIGQEQQTPLNYYAKELTNSNAGELLECMKMLLQNGASISVKDRDGLLPLDYVMRNEDLLPDDKYELVYSLLLQNSDQLTDEALIYIQNSVQEILYGRMGITPPAHILMNCYSRNEGSLLKVFETLKVDISYTLLEILSDICLKASKDEELSRLKGLLNKLIAEGNPKEILKPEDRHIFEKSNYLISLVDRCDKHNDKHALNALLQTLSINSNADNVKILKKARTLRNVTLYRDILNAKNLNLNECITFAQDFIHNMELQGNESFESDKGCFQQLIKSRHVDCCGADANGIPLLSFAANDRNEIAVKELLNQGAYLGMTSDYSKNPIENIRPEILEEHLDSCITIIEKGRDQSVKLDLRNICYRPKKGAKKCNYNDMTTISHIKNSRDLQHLLTHPVITVFLALKWQQYSKFFYVNLFAYCIYLLVITANIFCNFHKLEPETTITRYICLPFIICFSICEVVQFCLGPKHYLKSFINLIDIAIIQLSMLSCFKESEEDQNKYATYTLLFAYIKLFLLMRLLPIECISKPLMMLFEVVKTVFRSAILLFVLAVFGGCFYIRFGEKTKMDSTNSTNVEVGIDFSSLISSFMKTTIMSTGEYDASNMKFKSLSDYFLVFLFVIMAGIALFNLLTGLAVSDIQLINDQADIMRAIDRINFQNSCEEFLNHSWWNWVLLNWLKKPADQPVAFIIIRQYRYPYKMTSHPYSDSDDDATVIDGIEESEPLIPKKKVTVSDNTPESNPYCAEENAEDDQKKTSTSGGLFNISSHINKIKEFFGKVEHKPSDNSKHNSPSFGTFRRSDVINYFNSIKELFTNELIDTKVMNRAKIIAEKN